MSNVEFTPDQRKAVFTGGGALLVSAAAGSGKTAVLVERIINIILNGQQPVDIDRLLVVTFTDAAASEMRQRIGRALTELLAGSLRADSSAVREREARVTRQLSLLPKAQITTIHSFCLSVLRKYYHIIDLDPNFRVADQSEVALLRAEALDILFEQEYEREDNRDFFNLTESMGVITARDGALQSLVSEVGEFLMAAPWPEQALGHYIEMYSPLSSVRQSRQPWFALALEHIAAALEGVCDSIDRCLKICDLPEGPAHYINVLNDDLRQASTALTLARGEGRTAFGPPSAEAIFEELYGALDISFKRLPVKTGGSEKELQAEVQEARNDEIKKVINNLKSKYFLKPFAEMKQDLQEQHTLLRELGRVTLAFLDTFAQIKREKNIVDFSDLEQLCVRALYTDDGQPSPAAAEISRRYHEVMVDEYQDSSQIQELILNAVAGEGSSNLFMVGDVKQSIYRFRRADPSIFLEKYKSFSETEQGTAADSREDAPPAVSPRRLRGVKINLSENFRSRETVINAVNFFFRQLMSEVSAEIDYDDKAALYPGALYPELEIGEAAPANPLGEGFVRNISNTTEILLTEKAGASPSATSDADNPEEPEETGPSELFPPDTDPEAELIAKRIGEFVGGDFYIFDTEKKHYRPAEYRDIVVLTRTVRQKARSLTDTLRRRGVPTLAHVGGSFFDTVEISTMLSFLQIIDNPLQDIPLIAALHSPVYGVNSDELMRIRLMAPGECYFMCVEKYVLECPEENPGLSRKLERFASDLARWRDMASLTPVSRLLDAVYADTRYPAFAGAMEGGETRRANLLALAGRAEAYEKTAYSSGGRGSDLFHFVRYVERIRKASGDWDEAAPLSENENVVRVMSIHGSKGLEFPIVFVAGLGRGFNFRDERENLILHPKYGFGSIHFDLLNRVKSETIAHAALARVKHCETLAEELRVLYVAMTRAREKLVLTGCVGNLDKSVKKRWGRFRDSENPPALPVYYMHSASCFLDWIMPALLRHQDAGELLDSAWVDPVAGGREPEFYRHPARFKIFVERASVGEPAPVNPPVPVIPPPSEETPLLFGQVAEMLEWRYPQERETTLPKKISISEIKRLFQRELDGAADLSDHYFYAESSSRPAAAPRFRSGGRALTSTRRGTLIHTVLEWLDLQLCRDEEAVRGLIGELVDRNILVREEAAEIPVEKIAAFVNSPLAERIRRAELVKNEVPFVLGLPLSEVYGSAYKGSSRTVLVHGIVDCYFSHGDGLAVLDYKSDYIHDNEDLRRIAERYALQMRIYKRAIENGTGKKVLECLLFLLSSGVEYVYDEGTLRGE
ncbi:MAG: helicase-exonuclease AddAB subunit AddA [Clostridiales bacterium]|jgi:ATP-dependent helicase/nuclease subunit A|nr:helicase-exonuclease AddAB subunit AddA [Clostridiales bacterium]